MSAFIGGVIGLVVGGMFGGALFGLWGAAVGGPLGLVVGAGTVSLLARAARGDDEDEDGD